MKTRYIFTAIVAALTLFVTGCQKEADHYLNEIKVSSSYLSFLPEGGSTDLTITAADAWTIKELPEWITSSALSGAAGESTVKLTATAATETREATFYIECLGAQQSINVIQMTEKVERQVTAMKDVIAAGAGTFRIKGTVIKITSTSYGNFWMNDGTAEGDGIQVYGTLNKKGNTYDKNNPKMENLNCKDNPDAWELAPGDIITVEGPFTWYNTTPELVDVTVIEIERSLIGIKSVDPEDAVIALEGGELRVELENKGDGFHVVIPEDAKSWLSISDFGKDYVVLAAQPNQGGDRSTTVKFTTEKDGVTYSCEQAISQKGAILEVSIADFLAAAVGDTQFRLTGVITSNYEKDSQGQSFTIRDWSGETLVYRLNDYKASGAGVGDIITVIGKRGAYNDSPQMVSGVYEKHIVTVKGKTLAEIAAAADNAEVYYLATGTLKEIVNETYGNVWLSDASGDLYVYGCYPGWGATGDNRKNFLATAGIKVGDKLSVIGVKSTFNDAPQIANGIYFSHEEGEPGPGPQPQGAITIDGNPADWEGLAGVASATCPADAELTGIKSAKAYYGDKLYILTEFSDEALAKGVADGKLRFHVFFSGAEGLLSRFWKDENIQYMMEGKATSGGAYAPFSSNLYKFTGATSADWSWESTGITPTMESVGSGNFYELAFDYSDYPGGFPEQIEIGIDCADGDYAVLGYAPQTSHKFCLKKGEVVELPDDPDPQDEEGISVSQMLGLENDAAVESKPSLVAAVTARGFIATDGSKSIYVYTKSNGYDTYNGVAKVGDKVKFTGQKTVYGGVHEIQNVSALEVVSSGNAVNYPTAKDVTASAVDYTSEEAEFITFTGTLAVSGNYFNINIDGVDKSVKQGSVVYPVDTDALKAQDGKHLRFTGYFNGLTGSGKYLNIITTSIEE